MPISFSCSNCGRQIKVAEEHAGRRGKCPNCQTSLTVPSASAPDDDAYSLAPAEDRPRDAVVTERRCPSCACSLAPDAVICVGCGFDLRTGTIAKPSTLVSSKPQHSAKADEQDGFNGWILLCFGVGGWGIIGVAIAILPSIAWPLLVVTSSLACLAGLWKCFVKAGYPGWFVLIPVWNLIVLMDVVEQSPWWLLMLLIPFIGWLAALYLCICLAKAFGRDASTGIALLVAPWLVLPILAFSRAEYTPVGWQKN